MSVAALVLPVVAALAAAPQENASTLRRGSVAAVEYAARPVRGFDVRLAPALARGGVHAEVGARALDAIDRDLGAVLDATPQSTHAFLRSVPLFIGAADPVTPCACYHPSADWLERNGFDPAKVHAVEIANAETYLDWRRAQRSMVLHELAHAYLDQAVPEAKPRVERALVAARESGALDRVLRWSGEVDRHYGLTNVAEYFAETTEAFFGVNDFYPFVRAELLVADPGGAALIAELWGAGEVGATGKSLIELARVEALTLFARTEVGAGARLESALAPSFTHIAANGTVQTKDEVLDGRLRLGADATVEDARSLGPRHALVRCEHSRTRESGGSMTVVSTALFARDPSAPGGVVCLHLQETIRAAGAR
ncbi:MAG: hypothetical protein AAGA20_04725 [Planctomycetota bacterium]